MKSKWMHTKRNIGDGGKIGYKQSYDLGFGIPRLFFPMQMDTDTGFDCIEFPIFMCVCVCGFIVNVSRNSRFQRIVDGFIEP